MTPFAAKMLPKSDLVAFKKIRLVLTRMPDVILPKGQEVSCHMIARALARHFPLTYVDGHFGMRGWRHSWLVTLEGNIIDPYPWATVGSPLLIDMSNERMPWHHWYIPEPLEFAGNPLFLQDVERVSQAVKLTIENFVP